MSNCLLCLKFRCRGRVIVDYVLNIVAIAAIVGRGRICVTSFNSPTPKPRAGRNDLLDISYPSGFMAHFVSNFFAMTTGVLVVKFGWHHLIAQSRTPPVGRKDLLNISYTRRFMADFVSNFVAMATGYDAVGFVWGHSIARLRKPPVRRKDPRDISYIGRVIADFVLNFIAMTTGVGRSRICLASFNSPTPKTPGCTQRSCGYLEYKRIYSRFCPKFRCHGNGGHPVANLYLAVK